MNQVTLSVARYNLSYTSEYLIVTGDKKHLLPLKRYRGIPIVSPAEFLEQIG